MYQIGKLLKFPNLVHGFSTKREGNMSYEFNKITVDKKKVLENRKEFLARLDIDMDSCICLWVQHEKKIAVADINLAGKSMRDYKFAVRADGLLTSKKGLFLFLLVADCLPVILYDPKQQVVAVLHVGWKGADLNLAGAALRKLNNLYKSKPEDLTAGFGPAALKNSYIAENPRQRNNLKWQPFIEEVKGARYKVNFVGLCKKQLIDAGVKKKNIFESKIDTIKDTRFFSHYRDAKGTPKNQGRFACVVGMI